MRIGILGHLLNFDAGFRQAGVSRYTELLINALADLPGDDELVVYLDRGASRASRQRLAAARLAPSRLSTTRPEVRIAWEQLVAPLALARDGIDIVHAPVNVCPVLATRPTVTTVHDLAFLVYPDQYPGAKQRYLNALTRLSARQSRRLIAVSENTKRDLMRFYDVPAERIVVIPNGLDPECRPVDDPEQLAKFRRRHQLPERFILFVGTLQPRKNLIGLLRAWAGLASEQRWPLVVVGAEGWQYQPVYDEARSLGIADEVRFAGFADRGTLGSWYSAADLFVYPSLYEGFGLPVLEAMACGTPVITSSTSSLPEVTGDAALLVEPSDVDELREALARLTGDAALRAELRARGLRRASLFDWERTARETMAVYRTVLAEARAVPARA